MTPFREKGKTSSALRCRRCKLQEVCTRRCLAMCEDLLVALGIFYASNSAGIGNHSESVIH